MECLTLCKALGVGEGSGGRTYKSPKGRLSNLREAGGEGGSGKCCRWPSEKFGTLAPGLHLVCLKPSVQDFHLPAVT